MANRRCSISSENTFSATCRPDTPPQLRTIEKAIWARPRWLGVRARVSRRRAAQQARAPAARGVRCSARTRVQREAWRERRGARAVCFSSSAASARANAAEWGRGGEAACRLLFTTEHGQPGVLCSSAGAVSSLRARTQQRRMPFTSTQVSIARQHATQRVRSSSAHTHAHGRSADGRGVRSLHARAP